MSRLNNHSKKLLNFIKLIALPDFANKQTDKNQVEGGKIKTVRIDLC